MFTRETAALVVKMEQLKHQAVCATYGIVLALSRSDLVDLLQSQGKLADQAPALMEWLAKYERVSKHAEAVMLLQEAHRRLSVAMEDITRHRSLH